VRPSADKLPAVLTLREKEAASLIEYGLSNRQIASELCLSERTLENLVSKILRKLRFASQAEEDAPFAKILEQLKAGDI
jgi:DNA-binding NarL/FixJ family response regulator